MKTFKMIIFAALTGIALGYMLCLVQIASQKHHKEVCTPCMEYSQK